MARPRSRRGFVRAVAAGVVATLGGCGSVARDGGREPVTPAPVPTDPPTPTPPSVPPPLARPTQFAFDAAVVRQPSPEAPPTFRAELTNVGPGTIRVFVGASLLWSTDGVYPGTFVLLPSGMRPSGVPTPPTDGCWPYTADRRPAIPAIALSRTLSPGDRLATTFAVYSDPANDPCYPPGEYRVRDDVRLGASAGARRDLTVTLTIDDSGAFAVEPAPREIWV